MKNNTSVEYYRTKKDEENATNQTCKKRQSLRENREKRTLIISIRKRQLKHQEHIMRNEGL